MSKDTPAFLPRTRTTAACLDDAAREHDETWTLDRQIAQARREMGPEKWAALMAEWDEEKGVG